MHYKAEICEECSNFNEHCTCRRHLGLPDFDWGGEIAAHMDPVPKGPPPCPSNCICEICIEEAMNQALIGQGGGGVLPGDSLTSHLPLRCECGADKIGGHYHSDYCPKFSNGGNSNE